jgi:hypothetical protein
MIGTIVQVSVYPMGGIGGRKRLLSPRLSEHLIYKMRADQTDGCSRLSNFRSHR